MSKNYNIRDRSTHHFTIDGGIQQAGARGYPGNEQKRVRKPGVFGNGYSEFTVSQNSKRDIHRYESEVARRLKRAISEPPSQVNGDVISHFDTEQRPLAKPHEAGAARPSTARCMGHLTCSSGGVDAALRFDTREEIQLAREQRLQLDEQFAGKCEQLRRAHADSRSIARSTAQKLNHMSSTSMGNALRWD